MRTLLIIGPDAFQESPESEKLPTEKLRQDSANGQYLDVHTLLQCKIVTMVLILCVLILRDLTTV
jgi:hypothetical protein